MKKPREVVVDFGPDKQAIHALMSGRGAPKHLLRGSTSIHEGNIVPATHAAFRAIHASTQLGHLIRTASLPTYGSYLMVIGSEYDESLCQSVALGIMQAAMTRCVANPNSAARPYWHPVYGGWKDRLRDDENFRSSIGRVGLLILTNLADNSTPAKIEAARDLLHLYASVPRILVVSGADPLAFSIDVLRRKPSRVLYLTSAVKRGRGRARSI